MKEIFGSPADIRKELDSKILAEALAYWESLRVGDGLPGRSAINPMQIPRLLPTTFLVDIEENDVFRYRLAGSMLEERYQIGAMKGKTPRDVMGDAADNVLRPYRGVRDNGVLFYREASLDWLHESRKFVQYRVLLMPLGDDAGRVNMIFGVQDFIAG